MARRGRKRLVKAKRNATTREGRAGNRLGALMEQAARKAKLLGLRIDSPDDVRRALAQDASSPVVVLAARGLLVLPGYETATLLEAAQEYAGLYWRHIGSPHPTIGGYRDVARGSVRGETIDDPIRDAALERRFNAYDDALDSAGRSAARAVKSVVVDWCWPSDVPAADGLGRSRWPLGLVLVGLAAIVDFRRGTRA